MSGQIFLYFVPTSAQFPLEAALTSGVRRPLNDESKTTVSRILENDILLFTYDIRDNLTLPGSFLNQGHNTKGFRADTKVAVEMQMHSANLKTKTNDGSGQGYLFKLVGIYKLQDVEAQPASTPENGRRGAEEWIATPPRAKKTCKC